MKLKTIDSTGKFVVAAHLFNNELVQVFDKKTGDYLATINTDSVDTYEASLLQTDGPGSKEKGDPNQLKLF